MIRIQQLKLPSSHTKEELRLAILKTLKLKPELLLSWEIVKRSIDARKKPEIKFVYTIDVTIKAPDKTFRYLKHPHIQMIEKQGYQLPVSGVNPLAARPVIIGTGPAGLFCGLLLARQGYCPILLERGDTIQMRQKKVDHFWHTGILDEHSNVQFGEGGAGTFSDGKLNTAVKDPSGRNRYVLERFVSAGAPEEILWLNKPHIGTDLLQTVIGHIREEIIAHGGEVRFLNKVTDIHLREKRITALEINGTEKLECSVVILAIGHSARDTFEMLSRKPLEMMAKPFAVGVRIEHPQEMINFSQYGRTLTSELPVADYKLSRQLANGRGVYSFCMCPGGYVVNASSEAGRLAVNGMSYHDRQGENANSAMVVTVTPEDFGVAGVLAGMSFQRTLEAAAFEAGAGNIPIQLLGDFCRKENSVTLGEVKPNIKGNYKFGNLHTCFPVPVYESLKQGILECGQILKGFGRPDAILSGVESRTSSPLRILRNEQQESSIAGLYPCGEGAGYAGGITSAAMDGLRVAESIIRTFQRPKV